MAGTYKTQTKQRQNVLQAGKLQHRPGRGDNAAMTHAPMPPHTRHSPEIWDAIRRDYIAGTASTVLGERYGLTARSIRCRAALDQWRRNDEPASASDALRYRLEFDLETFPELADVSHVANEDLRGLLLLPNAAGLCRYAFRRAAECAALDGPNESAAWLRVVRLADQVSTRINVDVQPYSPADYLRASMIGQINGHRGPDPADEESDMSAMSAEIHSGADSGG